jgi:acetyl-CoA carboxylase biotin carboxyl carrier protein
LRGGEAKEQEEMARKEIKSEITGSVWKILKQPGEIVAEEDSLMILESMKMEIPVLAEASGTIAEIRVQENTPVTEGQVLVVLEV